jgi:hypothetical protein
MNAIQQISLKLQMGLSPSIEIQPELLRAMWRELSKQRYKALEAGPVDDQLSPFDIAHPSLNRAG